MYRGPGVEKYVVFSLTLTLTFITYNEKGSLLNAGNYWSTIYIVF